MLSREKPVHDRALALDDFSKRGLSAKPPAAIGFGKLLELAGLRRPNQREHVAFQGGRIAVAFQGPDSKVFATDGSFLREGSK